LSAPATQRPRVVICSKSPWLPPIRREHALATLARESGHAVTFIEQPLDVRALRSCRSRWLRDLGGLERPSVGADAVTVIERSTIAPGYRNALARTTDARLLARTLRRVVGRERASVVVTTPWQWPAVAGVDGVRRVFDCGDDWSQLLPTHAITMRTMFAQVSTQADAVIVNSPSLAALFPYTKATVVPNGTSATMLATPPTPTCAVSRTMVYAGTLSERFDAPLIGAVMEMLPEWRLELYGECRYAGGAARPGRELSLLLDAHPQRVRWHGTVDRAELRGRLDEAGVLVCCAGERCVVVDRDVAGCLEREWIVVGE